MIGDRWRNRSGTWWWAILVIVVPVAGLTAAAGWTLPLLVDVTAPSDRLEVVRIALTVGAGTGGVVALVLAGRRQWSSEQAHRATEHDADERRLTELYTKAVDQLGSDQAAVRLGGLYALERLANTTPTQQSTIGDVICAYLRMPYTSPPAVLDADATEDDRREHDRLTQELEIRQTAIEILVRHRNPEEPETCWPALRIRLQRANLTETDMHNADLANANLTDAKLAEADLTNANLTNANLTAANLTSAYLTIADVISAELPGATLTYADLTEADLTSADLNGAELTNADLTNADLTEADLTNADLTEANLTRAKLTGANLTDAVLTNTNLTDADLTNADLTRAKLVRTNLTFADLTGTKLSGAKLTDANVTGTVLASAVVTKDRRNVVE